MSLVARPEPAPVENVAVLNKPFTAKDGEAVQLQIKRVWELIDDIEAETQRFKETMQFGRTLH